MNIIENLDGQKLPMIRQIMDTSLHPLLAIEPDSSIVACNDALCQLLGMSRWEIENLPESAPDFHQCLRRIIDEISSAGYCHRFEKHCKLRNGRKIFLDISIFKVTGPDGVVRCYYASLLDITSQKVLEKNYRLIAENAYDLITIIDPETFCYKYVSPSHKRVVGFSAEELMGKHCFDHVHPDDRKMVKEKLVEGIKKGGGIAQYRTRKKDFTYVWLEAIGKLINRADGRGDVLLVTREINEKKLAELALKASEEKYRLIADNTMDIIALIEPDRLQFTYLSPSVTRVMGYSEDELIGTEIFSLVHPEELDQARGTLFEGLAAGFAQGQYRALKKDGSYVWLEAIGKIITNVDGLPAILLTSRDIDQRKNSEAALMASEERLLISEAELKQQLDFLNYLINNMNEVFVLYDNRQNITFVNNSNSGLMGYQQAELVGSQLLQFVTEEHRHHTAGQIDECLVRSRQAVFETVLIRQDGSEALVRIKSSPIIDDGEVQGGMLLIEDISEYRKLEKQIARLDQLNTVGEMAAGIGHEIRNPMTAVKGFLQMLSQYEEYAHHQHYFHLMLEELERANSIISEFLSLAKNKLVDRQPHNLNLIIGNLFPLLQADALLTEKALVLELNDIPELLLDEKEIRQLIVNLVRNGMEAMEAGGMVTIYTARDGEDVIMEVRDEGNGIAPGMLERLGTPFLTTKENGTGLGLAICYSIVARHGAAIEPIARNNGTTIQVCFKMSRQSGDGAALVTGPELQKR